MHVSKTVFVALLHMSGSDQKLCKIAKNVLVLSDLVKTSQFFGFLHFYLNHSLS